MKPCLLLGVMMVLLMTVCIADTAGARMYRPFSQEARLYSPPPPDRYGGTVVVKFHNGSDIQGGPDRAQFFLSSAVAKRADLVCLNAALVKAGANAPSPTFTRPVAKLRTERAAAERNVGEELPDLTLFYDVRVPDYQAAVVLLEELRTNALVEAAFARTLPDAPPTPDLSTNQIYLGSAATNGYDIEYAWSKPGGSGSQARLIDIEYDWTFDHEDLRMSTTNLLWGDRYAYFGRDHGTASIGISGALSNGIGMNGIIHNGSIRMISPLSGSDYVMANAINQAVAFSTPGDVILLEQQAWSDALGNYCPIEFYADVYSAIANATALGRIVIEPAGNGGFNLDDDAWGGIFQRSTRDSGAVMIGAGTCRNRSRCDFSCYGSRLDIQGWGDWSVATLGYTNLYGSSETNSYTGGFAGTSSASALSAAIAAAIQSYARVNYGFYLQPLLMRSVLVQSGYAQTFGLSGNIGPLPNLSNAFIKVDTLEMVTPSSGVSADYDGDRKADPAVYDEATGTWRIKLSGANYSQIVTTLGGLGGLGRASVAADYDGDHKADPAVYYEQTGRWAIMLSSDNFEVVVVLTQPLGGTGYSGMPGDYDGDGKADPGVYQRERGDWKMLLSSEDYYPVELSGYLGGTGYRAVAADYDGDHKADPAIYGENTGYWILKLSSFDYIEIVLAQTLGGSGYLPVPADYDGDQKADPAVRSATGNEWIVMLSSGGYAPVPVTLQFE